MNAVPTNKPPKGRYKYDVAFSFAEEDRDFVDQVADLLQGINTYYDDHKRVETWGLDLNEYLEAVYKTEARFCVMFISRNYGVEGRWSRQERQWAQARAKAFFDKKKDYILPFRLDNAEIPGLTDTIGHLSKETYDPARLAKAIRDKVKQDKRRRFLLLMWMGVFLSSTAGRIVFGLLIGMLIMSVVALRFDFPKQWSVLGSSGTQYRMRSLTGVMQEWRFRALCRDGWLSLSTGRGTCSNHHGVLRKIDTTVCAESEEQARGKLKQAFLVR